MRHSTKFAHFTLAKARFRMSIIASTPSPDSLLSDVLPPDLAHKHCPILQSMGLETAEDLYECIANVGGNWYKSFTGISRDDAIALVSWLQNHAQAIGQVTPRFYPSGYDASLPTRSGDNVLTAILDLNSTELLSLPSLLSGESGTNRDYERCSLEANNDLQAIECWLSAKASNPNTLSQYRKEAERFLLWCTMERGIALSSISAQDASLYPRWLEQLGRTEESIWNQSWKLKQDNWIGPKNIARLSHEWRPFNGPLTISSRKTALTVVRLLFNFLSKTGYLRFNPFDQVSAKVRYIEGEGAPKAYADRSLTPKQWRAVTTYLEELPDSESKARISVVLALGKGLGMRASEMIHAKCSWITMRRIGDEDMLVIEIVGKGDKIRRLPISESAIRAIDQYLSYRGLPSAISAPPDTPILNNLGVGRKSDKAGISRSGLYKALEKFFEGAAEIAQEHSATDAAKLRAGSTHWLRHTFATTALKHMDINVVQNAMGHASIGTTSRYLTPEEAQVASALRKMNGQ